MSNVLNEEKKQQVLALGRLGWALREIEKTTGVRRETAGRYLKQAGVAVRKPGRWGHASKAAIEVSPGSEAKAAIGEASTEPPPAAAPPPSPSQKPSSRSRSASTCERYRELIQEGLAKGRNAKAIWQDLVDDHGFTGAYQSVKRFVRKQIAKTPEPRAVIVTAPGEEAQVDYGKGPMVRDPVTGKYRRTRLFVLTLGYSRKCVRLLAFKSSSRQWADFHEQAFRRLGGVPKVIVLDNLKEGVIVPEFYDPKLNPVYSDLLKHYGTVALNCRINDPDRKGKVERSVGHAQDTPLKGERFESLEQAQSRLDRWEDNWADKRIHGTTKRQVAAMFAEEKPTLQPLPLEPFHYYQYGERTVHLDGCVEVDAGYYSVPPLWIGRHVQVQWDHKHVRILDPRTGQLLREHWRQSRGRHHIHDDDRPRQTPQGTQQLLRRAHQLSTIVGTFCKGLHEKRGQAAVRQIQGLLSMTKKHGTAALEQACALALDTGISEYHFIGRYLERQTPFPLDLQAVDPLIRELTTYRDVVAARLKTAPPPTTTKPPQQGETSE